MFLCYSFAPCRRDVSADNRRNMPSQMVDLLFLQGNAKADSYGLNLEITDEIYETLKLELSNSFAGRNLSHSR